MTELTKEEAIKLVETKWWEGADNYNIVKFQLFTDKLCMPFDVFHEAIESVLNRPVFTHEFAYVDDLRKEFLGEKQTPTFEEIINLIPKEKRLFIVVK